MLHKPANRYLPTLGGSTKTTGGSLKLAKGQFGIFDTSKSTSEGLNAVSSFAGAPKDREYIIKLGMAENPLTRSQNNKAWSTFPFKVSDVKDIRVSAPASTEQKVDEVVLGYNGFDSATAITFNKGDRKAIFLKLSGDFIGMLGYPENFVTVEYIMEADACNTLDGCTECDDCTTVECAPIVLKAIEFLKSYQLRGGVTVSDAVEINPVKSCETEPTFSETEYTFSQITVCDTGDDNALALVQAQYPDYVVTRQNRVGAISTYEILAPTSVTLDDYEQSISSLLKGCDACPDGYTATDAGILYAVTLEDDGVDLTTTVDNLPGFVTGSVIKQGQNNGVGLYTVLVDDELTAAEISTFVTANPTATVDKVGPVSVFCENSTTTAYTWEAVKTCNVSSEDYTILIPDDGCGNTRLTEVAAYYPDLTIAISQRDTANSSRTVTLTGTSGTANINVGGTDYLATFSSNLTTTAANWVTANAATILSATGATVTSSGAVITIVDATTGAAAVTITNATGDLAGTVTAYAVVQENVSDGCITQYETSVITNLVCDECDPIYKDVYVSEAPANFGNIQWTKTAASPDYTDCVCGIKFKGKESFIYADEALKDKVGFLESSVKIEVSGGYITEQREGLSGTIIDNPFTVTYLSTWAPRTHVGANFWPYEKESYMFFNGEPMHSSYLERVFSKEQSMYEASKQYVDYAITIERNQFAQSMSGKHQATNTYHITAEVGKHNAVETLLNKLAAAAGLPGVQA